MLEEITLARTFAVLLVFARVGAALSLLPGFSAAYVTVRVRLIIALALTLVVHPVVAHTLPPLPPSPASLALLVAAEVSIGTFIAVLARIVVSALQVAGTFIAYFASLANALVQDPVADQQTSTISGFLGTVGLVLIFVTDLHHLMLRALVASYERFPAGAMPPTDGLAEAATTAVGASMVIGLQLSAPFLVAALVYTVGLGLLGRLLPQLPVLFFGMPIQISFQIWAMALTMSGVMLVFLNHFSEAFALFAGP